MTQISRGKLPRGAVVLGVVRRCGVCGAEMLLQSGHMSRGKVVGDQTGWRFCATCAAKVPDSMGDTLALVVGEGAGR